MPLVQLVPILMFNEELTVAKAIAKFFGCLALFMGFTAISMLINYIVLIRGKMEILIEENLNLLDNMNEGIIVVSEKDRKLQFASKPAVCLLKQLQMVDEVEGIS